MGKIVGATLCSHVPRLALPPERRAAYMGKKQSTFYEALKKMYEEKIAPMEFDTFVVFDTHWWTTLDFILNGHEQLKGCYTSDEIPQLINQYYYSYLGDPELADLIAEEGKKAGLPMYVAREQGLPLHYATLMPMKYLNSARHRVLSTSIAYNSTVTDELIYGAAMRKAIEQSDRRVVLVASGGLSHKFQELLSIRKRNSADLSDVYSEENKLQDLTIIDKLKHGKHNELINLAGWLRERISPEGRFAHYVRLAGALGGLSCSIKGAQYGEYEAAAGTGQVNMWFGIPDVGGKPNEDTK